MNMPIQNSSMTRQLPQGLALEHADADAFEQEIAQYLGKYPQTEHIDICLHDLNGHIRGKRIELNALKKLAKGCYFPLSVYAMNLEGKVVEESGLGKYIGEPDRLCLPVAGSLRPCASQPEKHAQLYLTMKAEDGSDCIHEPRNILKRLQLSLNQMGYFPMMAGEIEFYLYPQQANHGQDAHAMQCFDVDRPDQYQAVLERIESEAKKQQIALTAIVAESSANQFEINIQHSCSLLQLCDDILAMKRIVKQIAAMHGLSACFMAKPSMAAAGSGLHFHMSLLDHRQLNLFGIQNNDFPNSLMYRVIAGLIDLLPASMAVLAPNINSFRRFQFGQHVPLEASWGINNRNAAIRLPCSDPENHRLEYRVAGADANPYLCISVILAGVLHGLTHLLKLPKAVHALKPDDPRVLLPDSQPEALRLFQQHPVLKQYLGQDFVQLWAACKKQEHQSVLNKITDSELKWGL
ncbi:glutamine synthetase family protein [Acinetobacter sp.]|uniref:glutamine synthetase family protein n=1 Tax=Acinetobacter sp. TaxID=472 RepID=UPI002FCA3258